MICSSRVTASALQPQLRENLDKNTMALPLLWVFFHLGGPLGKSCSLDVFPTTYCVPEIELYCVHFSSADMFCGSCLTLPPERLLNHENQGSDCCHCNEG